jgi:hypothetical protein
MVIGTGREPACFVSAVTSGPGPALAGSGPEDEDPDLRRLPDMGEDLVERLALADHERRVDALSIPHPLGEDVEMRLDAFPGLCAHDFAHADPVVELIGRE